MFMTIYSNFQPHSIKFPLPPLRSTYKKGWNNFKKIGMALGFLPELNLFVLIRVIRG